MKLIYLGTSIGTYGYVHRFFNIIDTCIYSAYGCDGMCSRDGYYTVATYTDIIEIARFDYSIGVEKKLPDGRFIAVHNQVLKTLLIDI